MPDYAKLYKEQEDDYRGLTDRQDDDSGLLLLKTYTLVDAKKKAVKNIINVTLNKPAVFAANVISALNSSSQQVVVESNDKQIDTHEIEEFREAGFGAANAILADAGEPTLKFFTHTQTSIRGRAARRVLFRIVGEELIPDIASWDTRFVRGERGKDDWIWKGYQTTRTKSDILAEYGVDVQKKEAKVLDIWTPELNEIWLDGKRFNSVEGFKPMEQGNPYGFVPVVEQIVPLGYGNILLDSDRLSNEGESIFFMIRSLVPELNRWVTILQTHHFKSVKGPMMLKKKGAEDGGETYDEVTAMSGLTILDVDENVQRVEYGDAIRATELVYRAIEKAIQEGSYTDIDIGNVRQPFSAVALIAIGESRDLVYLPRLATAELLDKATGDMFTKQAIQEAKRAGVSSVTLGTPAHKREFKISALEGEYETTYRSFIKSPKTKIAQMSVASQAEKFYDPETILTDILQEQDPKGIMQKRYNFLAEKVFPNVLKHRIIMSTLDLAEEGDENAQREAKIMADEMRVSLEQVKQGNVPQPLRAESGIATEPPVSLLGEAGQVGGLPGDTGRTVLPEEE